jgi:hypothetical protein
MKIPDRHSDLIAAKDDPDTIKVSKREFKRIVATLESRDPYYEWPASSGRVRVRYDVCGGRIRGPVGEEEADQVTIGSHNVGHILRQAPYGTQVHFDGDPTDVSYLIANDALVAVPALEPCYTRGWHAQVDEHDDGWFTCSACHTPLRWNADEHAWEDVAPSR